MNKLETVVKGLCNAKGIKLKELAEILGISPSTLSRNLAKNNPRQSTIKKLAAAFEITEDEFEELLFKEIYFDSLRSSASHPRLIVPKNHNDDELEIGGDTVLADDIGIKPKKSVKEVLNPVHSAMERTDIGTDSIPPILSATIHFMGRTLTATSIEEIKEITTVIEQVMTASNTQEMFPPLYRLEQKYGAA